MKRKLVAKRPIQYMGISYKRGAALPVSDPLMVKAWLKSGSAVWEEPSPEQNSSPDKVRWQEAAFQVMDCLTSWGVDITDVSGCFLGEDSLKAQLKQKFFPAALAAEHQAADVLRSLDVDITGEDGVFVGEETLREQLRILGQNLIQDYADLFQMSMDSQDEDTQFVQSSLSRLTKAELLEIAEKSGVDLSGCRNKAEQIAALVAAGSKVQENKT